MENFLSPESKRATKNQLHNNLGNNLTLLKKKKKTNFININFSQIDETKKLWES